MNEQTRRLIWTERRQDLLREIGKILVKTKALSFGTFPLASGKVSSYYVDLRMTPSIPGAFKLIVQAYVETIHNVLNSGRFETIAAIPTAGLTYGSVIAYQLSKPLVYVRGEGPRPTRSRGVEGILKHGSKVLVIDDLSMTGSSILKAAQSIRGEGGVVSDALVLIDRVEGARKLLQIAQIRLRSFTTILELANLLKRMDVINHDDFEVIRQQTITH